MRIAAAAAQDYPRDRLEYMIRDARPRIHAATKSNWTRTQQRPASVPSVHLGHAFAARAGARRVDLTQGPPGAQAGTRPRDFWAANEAFLALTRAWYTSACNVKRIRQLEVHEEEIANG